MKRKALMSSMAAIMALVMGISLAGCGNTASQSTGDTQSSAQETEASERQGKLVIGNLAYCNADEETAKTNEIIRTIALIERKDSGYVSIKDSVSETYSLNEYSLNDINKIEDLQPLIDKIEVKMYDNLTSMTMALQAGDITCMSLYDSVAAYVCARNDDLDVLETYNYDYDSLYSEEGLLNGMITSPSSEDFTFMMSEGSEELCKEFNTAIAGMKEDGTLKELTREYITEVSEGKEAEPVGIDTIDGADTVTVGVTGDLPPFDYISDSGEPAGFNTAILSEISRRIGKNIELVNIEAGARVMVLSTGKVDVVFWTRSRNMANGDAIDADVLNEDLDAVKEKADKSGGNGELFAKQIGLMNEIIKERGDIFSIDSSDGTINTDFFYSAPIVRVYKQRD